jgi:hypothetical protein
MSDEYVARAAKRETKSKMMDAENRSRKAAQALEKSKSAYKYFAEPKSAASASTDTSDHNGKYFQVITAGTPSIEKC